MGVATAVVFPGGAKFPSLFSTVHFHTTILTFSQSAFHRRLGEWDVYYYHSLLGQRTPYLFIFHPYQKTCPLYSVDKNVDKLTVDLLSSHLNGVFVVLTLDCSSDVLRLQTDRHYLVNYSCTTHSILYIGTIHHKSSDSIIIISLSSVANYQSERKLEL